MHLLHKRIQTVFLAISVLFLHCAVSFAQFDFDPQVNPWYPRFPQPAKVYRSLNVNYLGGVQGADFYMMQSLAGLAAQSVRLGTGDTMIWIDAQGHNEYWAGLLTDVLASTSIQDKGVGATWNLVDLLRDAGVVKGYIVYDFDDSARGIYADGTIEESVNVATSLAGVLGGIIIRDTQIATAQSHGLTQLADARGKTEQWAWDNYGAQFSTIAALVQDPKLPFMRDYSIAIGAFCMFGVDSLASTVFQALDPNTPILGWNQGDEFVQTQLVSQWGHWNAANNLSLNLALASCLTPGVDIPADELKLNAKGGVDLTALTWEENVHYTALLLSDGDSFNLNIYYLNDPEQMYYQHTDRGDFPFTWGASCASLYQTAPSVVRELASQATANDAFYLFGGGYYYPDLYGQLNGSAALADHLAQIRPLTQAMDVRMANFIFSDWDSAAAGAARTAIAQGLPAMDGFFGIDYNPYTAGQGSIYWLNDGTGVERPLLMARWTPWNNTTQPGGGTPLEVAAMINAAQYAGEPTTSAYFDWAIVHAWSFFQNGEDISQDGVTADPDQGIERGYGTARWIADNLVSHVRLVKADELIWYARLHLRTRQTFGVLAQMAQDDLDVSDKPAAAISQMQTQLSALSAQLDTVDYDSNNEKKAFFETLQSLRRRILAPDLTSAGIGFETSEGFEAGALSHAGWETQAGDPQVTTLAAWAGDQSLTLNDSALVCGQFDFFVDGVFWMDGYLKTGDWPAFEGDLPTQELGPLVRFSSDLGIKALNGNAAGGGSWVTLASAAPAGDWLRVSLRVDPTNHRYDAYLNNEQKAKGLGFKDAIDILQGLRLSGRSTVDAFSFSLSVPSGVIQPDNACQNWTLY